MRKEYTVINNSTGETFEFKDKYAAREFYGNNLLYASDLTIWHNKHPESPFYKEYFTQEHFVVIDLGGRNEIY